MRVGGALRVSAIGPQGPPATMGMWVGSKHAGLAHDTPTDDNDHDQVARVDMRIVMDFKRTNRPKGVRDVTPKCLLLGICSTSSQGLHLQAHIPTTNDASDCACVSANIFGGTFVLPIPSRAACILTFWGKALCTQ